MTITGIKLDKRKFPRLYGVITAAVEGLSFPIEVIPTGDHDVDGHPIVKLPNGKLLTTFFLITK